MFRPLLLEHFRTMVRLGLARSRVQPFLENKSSFWLLALGFWLNRVRFGEELKAKS